MIISRGPARICALTMALLGAVSMAQAGERMFRLLNLDGQNVSFAAASDGARPAIVTYALIDNERTFVNARNCQRMTPPDDALAPSHISRADFLREVHEAFAMWSRVARIEFREVSESRSANILIGAQAEPRGRAYTNVATRDDHGSGPGQIEQSLICLNPAVRWKIGFDGNLDVYDIRYTMAHEIGHAIGLDHPGSDGQLMSFRYGEASRDLRPGDIAGVTQIYGARSQSPDRQSPAIATTSPEGADPRPQNPASQPAPSHLQRALGMDRAETQPQPDIAE